jgi:hypothetical protein
MSTNEYVPMALTVDQCHAVMSACTAAMKNIENNPEDYDRILAGTDKTALDLMGLYASVVLYVADKVDGR